MEVLKYQLESSNDRPQRVLMPKAATIVRVAVQRDMVCLWAIVPDDLVPSFISNEVTPMASRVTEWREFVISMTGQNRPWITPERYVGTYDHGPYVLHLFETTHR